MERPTIQKISWKHHDLLVKRLARTIGVDHRIAQIVALGRGGFVPGVQLSHLLNIPLVPLMWQTRDGNVIDKYVTDKHSLIIDDINDSGRTLIEVTSQGIWVEGYCTAVLINKPSSQYKEVDFYMETGDDGVWYEFPWESKL
jgi:uncharacterized protein